MSDEVKDAPTGIDEPILASAIADARRQGQKETLDVVWHLIVSNPPPSDEFKALRDGYILAIRHCVSVISRLGGESPPPIWWLNKGGASNE